MRIYRHAAMMAVLCFSALLLGGCADASNEVNGAYATEIAEILKSNQSPFVEKVLKDGIISDGEIDEAKQIFITCLNENGVSAQFVLNDFGVETLSTTGEITRAAEERCGADAPKIISLYQRMHDNPRNEDLDDVHAACFVRHGLAPKDFTGKDLKALYASLPTFSAGGSCDSSSPDYHECLEAENRKMNEEIHNTEIPIIKLPGGRELNGNDQEVNRCLADPQW